MIEGLSQNQDFFTLLLQNEEIKKEVLGIFAEEIYKSLRDESNKHIYGYGEDPKLAMVAEESKYFGKTRET